MSQEDYRNEVMFNPAADVTFEETDPRGQDPPLTKPDVGEGDKWRDDDRRMIK